MKKKISKKHEAYGLKIGTDLLASCIVGTVVGIYLDKFFDTKPILLIICLILSLISALRTIFKYR
jgi:ATP synthase protein I